MISRTKTLSIDNRIRLFWGLAALGVILVGFYIYAVQATVANTVARQNLEDEVGSLSARLGDLEFKYIGLKNNITIEVAQADGFREVTEPVYVTRGNTGELSINLNR